MKTYHLEVSTGESHDSDGTQVAEAYGDVNVIGYVARDAIGKLDVNLSSTVSLAETDGIGGDETRTIVELTADAGTVGLVLKKRVSELRKSEKTDDTPVIAEQISDAPQELAFQ